MFLDSTIARFWFFNSRTEKLVHDTLSTIKLGRILDKQEKETLGIAKIGDDYGELIFAVNEGAVIFPDFFRRCTPPKGMHGYALPRYDTPILALLHPNKLKLKAPQMPKFVDVAPTILDFLELSIPESCEGVSLLK